MGPLALSGETANTEGSCREKPANALALGGNGGVTSSADSRTIPFDRLTAREGRLWLLALIVLVALAVGLALVSWQPLRSLPWTLDALPVGLVLLVSLFGAYAISRWREMAQLRRLARGLSQQPPSPGVEQVEKLFQLVQRSQRGYRDLIDTFDDLLLSLSLEGHIVAANRSFADLLGRSFHDLVGQSLDHFVEMADGTSLAALRGELPRLLEQRHWSGVLRVRLKHEASPRYFQCTIHALVREGTEQGLCVLARDITRERENEARFTELFETLQEGVYLAAADGKLEDVNPAFVRMLGYERREELLERPLSEFFVKAEEGEIEPAPPAETDIVHRRETTLRRRDGSTLTCAARLRCDSRHRRARPPPPGNPGGHHRTAPDRDAPASRAGICAPPGGKFPGSGRSPSIARATTPS